MSERKTEEELFENNVKLVKTYENSVLLKETWYKDGKYHREQTDNEKDPPCITWYDKEGNKTCEEWYQTGVLSRGADLPASISYWHPGEMVVISILDRYFLYKRRDPVFVPNRKQKEEWYRNGRRHRETGISETKISEPDSKFQTYILPAFICYYENGTKMIEAWFKDSRELLLQTDNAGLSHDHPYQIEYYEDGSKKHELWFNTVLTKTEEGSINKAFVTENKIHPNDIWYYKNGKKQCEEWGFRMEERNFYHSKQIHRYRYKIVYYENGSIKSETWLKNDNLHRYIREISTKRDGVGKPIYPSQPAMIKYYENGNKKMEAWHKDGQRHNHILSDRNDRDSSKDPPAFVSYYENGSLKKQVWWYKGEAYRFPCKDKNLPIVILYSEDGSKKEFY